MHKKGVSILEKEIRYFFVFIRGNNRKCFDKKQSGFYFFY